jgi:hypothetical protein
VAERTKVRPGILREIEADDHLALPALTYTLGFVKAYARTVGLDPQDIAERYRLESRKGEPVPTLVDLEPLEARRLPSRGLVAGLTAALVLVLGGLWAWGAGWFTPAPPAPPVVAAAPVAPPPTDEVAAPAAPAASAPVSLTASEEAWVRIDDPGARETLFMGTLAKGQRLDLPPGRDWQLRTGRAGVLEVRVGDQLMAPLGGAAEQVRGLSLKPEDLAERAAPAAGGLAPTRPIDPAGPAG